MEADTIKALAEAGVALAVVFASLRGVVTIGKYGIDKFLEVIFRRVASLENHIEAEDAKHDAAVAGWQKTVNTNTNVLSSLAQEMISLRISTQNNASSANARHNELKNIIANGHAEFGEEHKETMEELKRIAEIMERHHSTVKNWHEQEAKNYKLMMQYLSMIQLQVSTNKVVQVLPANTEEKKAA